MATQSTKGKLIEGIATKVEIDTETGAATLYYADRRGNFQVGATSPSGYLTAFTFTDSSDFRDI